MAAEIKTDMCIPSVYYNLSPTDLFARRPRFISMTRDTYLHDERLNWNKQVKSLTRRTEHTRCFRIKKAKIVSFAISVLIICLAKFIHAKRSNFQKAI